MKNTYSFEGQDMISSSILRQIKKGTYIDIGSNHPIKNNDTYYFYKNGWEGIIIEPNKKFNSLYKKYRPKDCLHNFLIGIKKNYKFFFFKDNTLSTSDIKTIKRYKKKNKITKIQQLSSRKLNDVLFDYQKRKKKKIKINLLKIDVEGSEFEILKSLDLKKYCPDLIQIELKNLNLNNLKNKINSYLFQKNYRLVCKTLLDSFYVYKYSKKINFLPINLYR